jgi:hypothetical protein
MRKLSIGQRVQRGAKKAVASTRFVLGIWLLLGVVGPYFKRFMEGDYDNYKIFKNSFFNLLNEETLYGLHPDTGLDLFLYGPFSCVLIAPFALLPDHIGCLLFLLASALLLFFAIQALPLSRFAKNGACLLCLVEFGNNQQHFQTNAIIAGFIILSLVAFCRRREAVAAMSITVGVFTKLYGIIALPFALFAERKARVVAWLVLFFAVAFVAPMLFSSSEFVVQSYEEWPEAISQKHQDNIGAVNFQDKSVSGLVRRVTGRSDIPDLPFLLLGGVLFMLPYLVHLNRYNQRFHLLALSSALMFVVLFSTSAENPTFIILQCGAAIWCVGGSGMSPRTRAIAMACIILFSSLSPTDAYPEVIREFYGRYSLRVVPCILLWLFISWEMLAVRRSETV